MCVAIQVADGREGIHIHSYPDKRTGGRSGRRLNYQMPFGVFSRLKALLSKQNKYLARTEEAELNSTELTKDPVQLITFT